MNKCVTLVQSSEEAAALLGGMDVSSVVVRDRALIAVLTYTFARVGALVALNVEDHYPQKKMLVASLSREKRQGQ